MERKVDASALVPGMYVSRLDRPWLESPFLYQGFRLDTWEQVQQVQRVCSHVYIDEAPPVNGTRKPARNLRLAPKIPARARASRPTEAKATWVEQLQDRHEILPTPYPVASVPLAKEMERASILYRDTRRLAGEMFKRARLGQSPDIPQAREAVVGMVQSVLRNPDALLWLSRLKTQDEYTFMHSLSVCILALNTGRALGLPKSLLVAVGLGAILHDIGKIRVPDSILNKPGPLTPEETAEIRRHPVYGAEILKDADIPSVSRDIILSHHERLDGSGYVRGLHGADIAPLTQLVSICDVYDAVTSARTYKQAIAPQRALHILYTQRGSALDSWLVERFIDAVGIYSVGTVVELNTREVGIVTRVNPVRRLQPIVLTLLDPAKRRIDKPRSIDLSRHSREVKHEGYIEIVRTLPNGTHGIDLAHYADYLQVA